ncbi:MAG: formylmethanofuran dehydrogenase subunit E family protein [Candidatus Bathyarchaeota archaeon]|nr:formylmethanofuran dehydrogenase subunit E family protein [Candidatus Bathyarchaeota archaeon]MDH5495097.1 formylmethanofuran dehydrogenase subunit E family protein [Candidatus Bathyarchaeota archaeon]
MTLERNISSELTSILEKAAEFHGHLGPFLVIGVRMGLTGLSRLGIKRGELSKITASLPHCIPFSCIIDGLQITTKCTTGNQKLSLIDSEKIQAEFERKDTGQKMLVALNQSMFEKLKSQLLSQETLPNEEVRELAWKVAAIPEDKLFVIT